MIPRPEVYVSASCEGDFRDQAALACLEFKRLTGRLPNYVGVTLEMVEGLEDAYDVTGIDACNPPGVPLLFVEATDTSLPPITTLRMPPASDRVSISFARLPSDPPA